MTRRRWIADEVSAHRAALTGDHAGHLVRVLRVRVGQEFDIATASTVRRGRIISVSSDRVEFDLGEEVPAATSANLTLLLSVFKFDRFEWAIEKCTELGVARIIPVIARRTDAHLASAAPKRVERWRKIALQAAEQSRRASPPQVDDPVKLAQAVATSGALRMVLSETERSVLLRDVLASDGDGETLLAIGPEGGWTDDELQTFSADGWISASLGSTILRAETAAIAATAIAISEMA
jgi:16S rRNA (uracil1498-N3)-methyltransferase